jgi:ATP-dependent DNA ligase
VFSRHGRDWTDLVPLIAEALLALRGRSVTLDGEGNPDAVAAARTMEW